MRKFQPVLCALLGAAIVSCALAPVSPATAAVYSSQQALPAQTVQQFLADPAALLTQYPNGGPALIAQVRNLAASDPATLTALVGLLASANSDQATAIGTGLGQVAQMAVRTDQSYANDIQVAVVTSRSDTALASFKAVVGGDIQLAATSGGVGGSGGGGEEGTSTTSGLGGFFAGSALSLTTFAKNTPDTFPTFSFAAGTPGATSVSPSQ
jgi:hypothetical protein